MREIKFRGRRKRIGDWVYGDFYHTADGQACIDEWEIDPKTVGQFTGLRDSTTWEHLTYGRRMNYAKQDFKGVEIYEGDVLRFKAFGGKQQGTVRWDEGCANYQLAMSATSSTGFFRDTARGYEVIGNIY